MISHSNGSAEWHREQLGIKTPEQQRIAQLERELQLAEVTIDELKSLRMELITSHGENEELSRELAEFKRDAERWHEYQARKIRLTEAGFGKSPLRDAAIADMGEKK